MIFDDNIPKYRKKKESSVSKSKKKSNHPHKYVECVLIDNKIKCRATRCETCGKIYNLYYWDRQENINRYDSLPQIKADDIWGIYINI